MKYILFGILLIFLSGCTAYFDTLGTSRTFYSTSIQNSQGHENYIQKEDRIIFSHSGNIYNPWKTIEFLGWRWIEAEESYNQFLIQSIDAFSKDQRIHQNQQDTIDFITKNKYSISQSNCIRFDSKVTLSGSHLTTSMIGGIGDIPKKSSNTLVNYPLVGSSLVEYISGSDEKMDNSNNKRFLNRRNTFSGSQNMLSFFTVLPEDSYSEDEKTAGITKNTLYYQECDTKQLENIIIQPFGVSEGREDSRIQNYSLFLLLTQQYTLKKIILINSNGTETDITNEAIVENGEDSEKSIRLKIQNLESGKIQAIKIII